MTAFWQQVQTGTYDNHVLPFLWLKGEPRETIVEYLEQIAGADIREVCLESRTHPEFCRDGWWNDLRFIIGECKRLGLKIWLLDDAHFPTGYANGALAGDDADPALKKTVLRHHIVTVAGPQASTAIKLGSLMDATERFVGAAAFDGQGRALGIPLAVERDARTDEPRTLRFDAPGGVTRIELFVTSQKTGYRDDYINMVDAASCRMLIDAVYEPTFRELGDEFGRTILGFFTDEPGFMNEKGAAQADATADSLIGRDDMALPWSPELEQRLATALGEDWLAQLPALWMRDEAGAAVRHAYMDIATQLYRECFDEQVGDWCRAHGVMHIGHVIEDKSYHTRLGQGAGHYFRAVAGQDMAGVDVVINQLVPGVDEGFTSYFRGKWDMRFFNYTLAKLGSSAARLDPKKQGRCMAEVFGAFGWHEGLREMKWIADHMLVRGVNRFTPHAFSMAKFPDWDCPPHLYARGNDPFWPHFGQLMGYMNRMATLLSGGRAACPVAVLYHADAEWAGDAQPVDAVAAALTRAQVDFDFVPAEAFEDGARYKVELLDGAFTVNGNRYRAFVMPRSVFTGTAVAGFAERAVAAGVAVHAVDALPRGVYDGDTGACTDGGPVTSGFDLAAALAGVTVTPLDGLAPALAAAGLATVSCDIPQPWLRTLRYERDGETYLMFFNEHPHREVRCRVTLPGGDAVEGVRLDLLNGGTDTGFDGMLELAGGESCVVVLGARADGLADAPAARHRATALELTGPWTVALKPAGGDVFGPEQDLPEPCDLTAERFAGACGTFRYRLAFKLGQPLANAALDLGEVFECATATLDGHGLGTRICAPYIFELGDLAAGPHELAVDVINTLDHAVPDIFALTEAVAPSGILGPVRLLA